MPNLSAKAVSAKSTADPNDLWVGKEGFCACASNG